MRLKRRLRDILTTCSLSFLTTITYVATFIKWAYMMTLSSSDSKRKFRFLEKDDWWISIEISDLNDITMIFLICINRYCNKLFDRFWTSIKIITSQLLMWVSFFWKSIENFSRFKISLFISTLILKSFIKYILRIQISIADLLFLIFKK